MNALNEYGFLVPIFPLVSAILIILGLRKNKFASALVSISGVTASLIYSIFLLVGYFQRIHEGLKPIETSFNWLSLGGLKIKFGILLDPLGLLMLVVVCLVSLLVQVYSHGYMKDDEGYSKFFCFLSMFTTSMLALVISPNLFQFYIFWELVGLCSYLLIGFWHKKESASKAALKAFLINKIGDTGLLISLLLIAFSASSFWAKQDMFLAFSSLDALKDVIAPTMLTVITLFMFLGPMAKSAQFPLHVWLPDAMEGPTPISALIHSATMVAAGVFLLARTFVLYEASPVSLVVVAVIGIFTAVFSGLIALTQYDIKKALAYSTCSQLGFMIASVGIGAWIPAIFHLITHAFFKSLLFLGSGSVIHGCHDEQDMREYGGLRSKMPITAWTFLIGSLALSGFPFLAGFYSKEEILAKLFFWSSDPKKIGFIVMSLVSALTAFYSFRTYMMTFEGKYRGKEHPHESPPSMFVPLICFAVPSIFAGYAFSHMNLFAGGNFESFLSGETHKFSGLENLAHESSLISAIVPITLSLLGLILSLFVYSGKLKINELCKKTFVYKPVLNKFYLDEVFLFFTEKFFIPVFSFVSNLIDSILVEKFIYGSIAAGTRMKTKIWAKVYQSGQTQSYIMLMCLGFCLVLLFVALHSIMLDVDIMGLFASAVSNSQSN